MKTFLFERNFFMIYSGISFSLESMKPFAKFVSIRTGSKNYLRIENDPGVSHQTAGML